MSSTIPSQGRCRVRFYTNQQNNAQSVPYWLVMHSMLPPPPEDSRLAKWIEDGNRHELPGSNIATVTSPDERYALTVERDSREMF